jgi:hypothetical protein
MSWLKKEPGWSLCLVGAVVHFGLCTLLEGDGSWYLLGFSYALLWPTVFAFTILPGALIGAHVQTWQASFALTEIVTIVVAIAFFSPTLAGLFQSLFRQQLIMTHLALFPPLLLSVLIGGHFGGPR